MKGGWPRKSAKRRRGVQSPNAKLEKEKEEEEDYGSWEEFDKDCDKVLWEGSIKSPGEI